MPCLSRNGAGRSSLCITDHRRMRTSRPRKVVRETTTTREMGKENDAMKKTIPVPVCSTCGTVDETAYHRGDTSFVCPNCGTEMRYLPAGDIWNPGASDSRKNNGWVTTFSVKSGQMSSARWTYGVGVAFLAITVFFALTGKIGFDGAFPAGLSGAVLVFVGLRKQNSLYRRIRGCVKKYPYWQT